MFVKTSIINPSAYQGQRSSIAVGQFDNKSGYQQGIFSDGVDRVGSQAKAILMTYLQQSGHFMVLDRTSMTQMKAESQLRKESQDIVGAKYIVIGNVTEFGRKEIGDKQLFGILGRGKKQVAYAKVGLNIVNIKTSAIVYSVQGAGEFNLSNREIVGFGGTAGYDSTLTSKVLDLAIHEAVNALVMAVDNGSWKPEQ